MTEKHYRSISSIKHKCARLHLTSESLWTNEEELAFISIGNKYNWYKNKVVKEFLNLYPNRTGKIKPEDCLDHKIIKLGLKWNSSKQQESLWTNEEDFLLKQVSSINLTVGEITNIFNLKNSRKKSISSISNRLRRLNIQYKKLNIKNRLVYCITTDTLYKSVKEASVMLNIPTASIQDSLSKHKQAYGHYFEWRTI